MWQVIKLKTSVSQTVWKPMSIKIFLLNFGPPTRVLVEACLNRDFFVLNRLSFSPIWLLYPPYNHINEVQSRWYTEDMSVCKFSASLLLQNLLDLSSKRTALVIGDLDVFHARLLSIRAIYKGNLERTRKKEFAICRIIYWIYSTSVWFVATLSSFVLIWHQSGNCSSVVFRT